MAQIMPSNIKKTKEHDCKLLTPPVEVLNLVVDSGIFIKCRRGILRWLLIYDEHPCTPLTYKSSNTRELEDIRILSHRGYIIHPFSKLSLYWEFIFMIAFLCYIYNLMIMALIKADMKNVVLGKHNGCNAVLDIFFFLDLLKTFITGYFDKEFNRVVINRAKIVKHYLKTWFIVDLLPCVFSVLLVLSHYGYKVPLEMVAVSRYLNYLKLVRCPRLMASLNMLCYYVGMSNLKSLILRNVTLLTVLLLTIMSLLFFIKGNYQRYLITDNVWIDLTDIKPLFYLSNLLFHVSTLVDWFMLEDRWYNKYFSMGVTFIGFCLQLYLFVQIYTIWFHYWSIDKSFELYRELNEYFKYKRLPSDLRGKILNYYDYQYKNRFFNESSIQKMLPEMYKEDILLHTARHVVKRLHFLKELPETVMMQLVLNLKSEIFLTNDVIIKAGASGDYMYFIYYGTVSVYLPNGKEMCHLSDGEYFGEIGLLYKETRVATVKAVTPCEMFKLTREDFLAALKPYPELRKKIYDIALHRLQSVGTIQFDV